MLLEKFSASGEGALAVLLKSTEIHLGPSYNRAGDLFLNIPGAKDLVGWFVQLVCAATMRNCEY